MTQHRFGTVWRFRAGRFTVSLELERDRGYRYDGDDENGETQAKLDAGEYVAFDSTVRVELDGETIGRDDLGGSVYGADEVSEFYTAHRDPDAMNRNCSIMRAARGPCIICHYFPGMVEQAVAMARDHIREMKAAADELPRVREMVAA